MLGRIPRTALAVSLDSGCLIYCIKFWGPQRFTRGAVVGRAPTIFQAASDLKLVVKETEGGNLSTVQRKWKYGFRFSRRLGQDEREMFSGLVRENECVSWKELSRAIGTEDDSLGGEIIHEV